MGNKRGIIQWTYKNGEWVSRQLPPTQTRADMIRLRIANEIADENIRSVIKLLALLAVIVGMVVLYSHLGWI